MRAGGGGVACLYQVVADPGRGRTQGFQPGGGVAVDTAAPVGGDIGRERVTDQAVPELVVRTGVGDDAGVQGGVEVGEGVVIRQVGERDELVGVEGRAQHGHPLQDVPSLRAEGGQRDRVRGLLPRRGGPGPAGQLDDRERRSGRQLHDAGHRVGAGVGLMTAGQLLGVRGCEGAELVDDGAGAGGQAGPELLEGVGQRRRPVPDQQRHALAGGAAGQVVGEAQAGLIGFVEVVEHENGAAVGGGEAQQLGDGHEEPLVPAFAAPVQVRTGQGPLDLGPVVVVEPVEQDRMAPAEIGDGLQDRRIGPGAFDGGGHAPPRSPPSRLGFASGPSQQRGLAGAGGPRQQQGAPALAVADLSQERVDQGALAVPSEQVVLDRGRGLGHSGLEEAVAQSDGLLAGRHAQLADQGPVQPFELAQRPVPVPPRRQGPHQLQMGLFVGPVELHQVVPAVKSPQQVGAQLADPLSGTARPLLVEVLGQQVASAAVGRGVEQRLVSVAQGLLRGDLE